MILLIDNYDSFVHNLARYFQRLGQETLVVRNDALTADVARRLAPSAIVISPGPCTPAEAGCSVTMVEEFAGTVPILGVCLGHQSIAAAMGGRVVRAPAPRHGRTSMVSHENSALLAGVPSPFAACRYHSLVVDEHSLPEGLRVTARAKDDACIMVVEDVAKALYGMQFHPEAVLTCHGYQVLANFLQLAGLLSTADVPALAASERPAPVDAYSPPTAPVTF